MTTSQEPPATTRQYRLATFGIPALIAPGGDTVLGTHGHHRRRLALLAVLAAAGERGRTRDQLLVLFWPEATQSRARHSLDQLLYALRGSLGESVFASVNPVRLNPELVVSDVTAFNAAVEHDDLEAAVRLYRGPFLDGFYLDDGPEFEQWLETERARLAASHASALERLARKAEAARDWQNAVSCWQRLTVGDGISSKYAAGLVRSLVGSGDQAAALRFAERYEAIVAAEFGLNDPAAAAALIAEVRAMAKFAAPPGSPEPAARPAVSGAGPSVASVANLPRDSAALPPNGLDARPARRRWRSTYVIGLAAAAVILGGVAYLQSRARARVAPVGGERSIAVLPLANVSRDAKDVPIADGLTEELVGVLAQLRGVRVAARTSAGAFRNSDLDVRRIGDSLRVDYVLEGSVQKAGDRIRVQVRLVDTQTGASRWSETYDRELRDVFAVQSDIAGAVARELNATLGGDSRAMRRTVPTRNPAAYELYLRGNDPATTRGDSASRAGLEYFRQALALDSQYAAAHAGLARLILTRLNSGFDSTARRRDVLAAAEAAAARAIALDPTLPDGHLALAGVRRSRNDFAGAEVEIRRAIALDPTNPRFHEWLVQDYASTGHPVEALAEARRAVALDPLSPNAIAELGHALLANDRCDEALAELGKLRSLRPPLLRAGEYAAQCYVRKRMWAEAIAEVQRNAPSAGLRAQAFLGFLYARSGQPDRARPILAKLLARAQRVDGAALDVAMVYAGLGDTDQAFDWLDRAVREGSLDVAGRHNVILDALAPDPRVEAFRQRLGIQNR